MDSQHAMVDMIDARFSLNDINTKQSVPLKSEVNSFIYPNINEMERIQTKMRVARRIRYGGQVGLSAYQKEMKSIPMGQLYKNIDQTDDYPDKKDWDTVPLKLRTEGTVDSTFGQLRDRFKEPVPCYGAGAKQLSALDYNSLYRSKLGPDFDMYAIRGIDQPTEEQKRKTKRKNEEALQTANRIQLMRNSSAYPSEKRASSFTMEDHTRMMDMQFMMKKMIKQVYRGGMEFFHEKR